MTARNSWLPLSLSHPFSPIVVDDQEEIMMLFNLGPLLATPASKACEKELKITEQVSR